MHSIPNFRIFILILLYLPSATYVRATRVFDARACVFLMNVRYSLVRA